MRPMVLALYDPAADVKISADASSFGLGVVLLQRTGDNWRPVAYASRSMSDTERRYAQIEKEALAITSACEKFSNYVLGRSFHIESDHKPLIPLLSTKHLDALPPRVLLFRLCMAKYDYVYHHKCPWETALYSRHAVEGPNFREWCRFSPTARGSGNVHLQYRLHTTGQQTSARRVSPEPDTGCRVLESP